MATIIEKAMGIAEKSGGIYEVFTSPSDVMAYIDGAPVEEEEIWAKRVEECKALLADFTPCIFNTMGAFVEAEIRDDHFWFDGKEYTND